MRPVRESEADFSTTDGLRTLVESIDGFRRTAVRQHEDYLALLSLLGEHMGQTLEVAQRALDRDETDTVNELRAVCAETARHLDQLGRTE